jgi:hypothetical protein
MFFFQECTNSGQSKIGFREIIILFKLFILSRNLPENRFTLFRLRSGRKENAAGFPAAYCSGNKR